MWNICQIHRGSRNFTSKHSIWNEILVKHKTNIMQAAFCPVHKTRDQKKKFKKIKIFILSTFTIIITQSINHPSIFFFKSSIISSYCRRIELPLVSVQSVRLCFNNSNASIECPLDIKHLIAPS